MRLFELFDNSYNWKLSDDLEMMKVYDFKTKDGDHVSVDIEQGADSWYVRFERNADVDVTGGGDALAIFSTVIDIIMDFAKKHPEETIVFDANNTDEEVADEDVEDGSRVSLYTRLLKRYAAGYDVDVSQKSHKTTRFILHPQTTPPVVKLRGFNRPH